MGGWSGCDALMSGGATAGLAAGVVCAVLAVLLVAAIALGFGALRARLAPPQTRLASPDSAWLDGGLLGAWRFYRRVGHVEPTDAPTVGSVDSLGTPLPAIVNASSVSRVPVHEGGRGRMKREGALLR